MSDAIERGTSPPQAPKVIPHEEMDARLSELVGKQIRMPESLVAEDRSHLACPACGSTDSEWAVGIEPGRPISSLKARMRNRLMKTRRNRLVWKWLTRRTRRTSILQPELIDDVDWAAETFLCRNCDAGWVESVGPEPIRWVRPWRRDDR